MANESRSYGVFFSFPTPKNCARVFMECYFAVQWIIVGDVARNFDLPACSSLPSPLRAPGICARESMQYHIA